jgi:cytochrome b6-f complex iron-sulfur subunit
MSRKKPKRLPAATTGSPPAATRRQSPSDTGAEPPADVPASPPRRRLLAWMWGGLLATLAGEAAWITGSFLRPRGARNVDDATVVVAGPVTRFEPGTVTAFPGGKFYLARLEDGGFLALDRTCTHLGCTVPWDARAARFNCPCHASSFDITGAVLAPPAPRPLDLFFVRIENGVVKVDTGQRQRRQEFAASQVARV